MAAIAKEGGTLRVNVIEDLSKTTLDVIGLAGETNDKTSAAEFQ